MKKYLKKFSTVSSTTKLFFFIGVILAVVVLASSGFYIQYKNGQKPVLAESASSIQTDSSPKSTAAPLKSSSDHSPALQGTGAASSTTFTSTVTATTTDSHKPSSNVAACTKQVLRHRVVRKVALWLPSGETQTTPGQDGYSEICPGKSPVTKNPVDQIIYLGTKPLSEVTSLLNSVADGLRD